MASLSNIVPGFETKYQQNSKPNGAKFSVAPKAAVTVERWAETDDLSKCMENPHIPRATKAVDKEHPNGTEGWDDQGMTVVQQHVAFFDRNHDGIVYPWETFAGFRAIGFNLAWSFGAMLVINGAFSYATLDSWIPSLTFPIYIKNLHKAKHGSDSETLDTEGRFVPQKFEEIFTKYDKDNKGALTFNELLEMTNANMNAADFFGWFAEKLEWGLTYLLLKDDRGLVNKNAMRGIFDGSIFAQIEQEIKSKQAGKKKIA